MEEYNKYMGGVDLADQRRLHSNCTLMGQHRWWLKLFFYLLDVGTANALVLYNSTVHNELNKLNIVDFKIRLILGLVGPRIQQVQHTVTTVHELSKSNGRHYCVYCALMSVKQRTRFRCCGNNCN